MSLHLRPDVRRALDAGKAVVALESSLISHGLPYPENLRVAHAMEAAVREESAVPATIAILKGEPVVGLDEAQLEHLARSKGVRKCSRRDLAVVTGQGLDGATTVAGTLILAHQAGVRVFATGGIGGVHRGHPSDVSADLEELARTPLVVVCSGAKALLDLEATRERLETCGVPIVGYQTDDFPAFYSRRSGLAVDARADTPQEVVAIARSQADLGLTAALLVAVPVPAADELPREEAEAAIAQAVRQADEMDLHGAAVTPFLLARTAELTAGRSLQANWSLLINNARVAARIAQALVAP
ncbi:MAG: pseudouridine-5-phosphate glycosidase [Anaerolineae bacterium SM23_84]|nr:MAG: pseudouridine-5-phosphate glycosidase [Anaerolineae bacterium SM23_84]